MSERTIEKRQDWTSDIVWVALYSILVFLLMTGRAELPALLRHSCGYKLANDGHDTRAIQHYLRHRSIASTVRYTTMSPHRFRGFWKD